MIVSLKPFGYLRTPGRQKRISVNPKKNQCLKESPVPITKTYLRSFFGLAGYYRSFLKCFAKISDPHHAKTLGKVNALWREEINHSFVKLKQARVKAPFLAFTDF